MSPTSAISRLREVIRRKHFAISTEESYAAWMVRFMTHLDRVPCSWPSERKLESFLSRLAREDVSASTQNQAFNALLFFYREVLGQELKGVDALRAKRAATIRRAPSVDEVRQILGAVRDESGYPARLIVRLLYGCGLRVSEPLNLRIRDVNLRESTFLIRQAKGRKDRLVAIPCSCIREIEAQMETARAVWKRDVAAAVPVKLPGLLARKYPRSQFAWDWAWLFPQAMPCRDPRLGQIVRWHMLESVVQRCVRRAARALGLAIVPHELRHAYATHALNRGANIRALGEAMGHANIQTTLGYCHAEALSVPSPLEAILR